ncbi:MAG TPA: energy transducer TonB [Candidatus Saccharimonadales bacterium]|jgi:hypothetical protein|nr:energy transducer TonB [Candidatus Saccharimonadales bacterium]
MRLSRLKPLFLILPALLLQTFVLGQAPAGASQEPGPGGAIAAARDSRPSSRTLAGNEADFPEPESGAVARGAYANQYFGLSYPLPADWTENVKGPPSSDTGYYILSSLKTADTFKGPDKGLLLISALDMFFVAQPMSNPLGLLRDIKVKLPPVYTLENEPAEVKIGSYSFARLGYTAVGLHWTVLATEVRCHLVQFGFTSRDPKLLENLIQGMNKLQIMTAGGPAGSLENPPPCVKDYATGANVLHKVAPVMAGPRFTTVPVRVIIGADGKVKHMHVIYAVPEQAKSVEDALAQWIFKPYMRNGIATEVETGILFKFPAEGTALAPVKDKY